MKGLHLGFREAAHAHPLCRCVEVRPQVSGRPASESVRGPSVVVPRPSPGLRTAVVSGAATHDPCAVEGEGTLAGGRPAITPVVTGGQGARIEKFGGPPPRGATAVVRTGLDEQHTSIGPFGQAAGHDTAGRSTANYHDIRGCRCTHCAFPRAAASIPAIHPKVTASPRVVPPAQYACPAGEAIALPAP